MTGDGVNDILALREADCSIVMAEGDPATRQIANLVLLNSDFNDVPEILFEGRRVVNNIARIAPIFLVKTIYSFILTMICISSVLLGNKEWLLVFPFIPVQITLFDQFVEGFPPFVLTFERNIRPVEPKFLKKQFSKPYQADSWLSSVYYLSEFSVLIMAGVLLICLQSLTTY